MTDFDYDAMIKKRIAQGAKHKVGRRHGCRFPSDGLTEKEIAKRHGEVYKVNINQPITYAEYKALPKDLKETYYNHLITEFHVGSNYIAKMMGCKGITLRNHNAKNGINTVKAPNQTTRENYIRFEAFCKQAKEPEEKVPEIVAEDPIDEILTAPLQIDAKQEKKRIPVTGYHLNFENVDNWADVVDFLATLPLPQNARICIDVHEGYNGGDRL